MTSCASRERQHSITGICFKSPGLWSWELLVGRREADQGGSRGVTVGRTNTSFARLALCVLVEQETFAIVHPGGVYASY